MINRCFNRILTVVAGSLLLCTSCGDPDLFDSDKWSDNIEGIEPAMRLKVAHGSFTLWNLLQDTTGYIQKIPDTQNPQDSILAIKYEQKDIYQLNDLSSIFDLSVDDLMFDLPDFEIPTAGEGGNSIVLENDLDLDSQALSSEVVLGDIPEGCELKEIFVSAKLAVALPRADFNYELTIDFDNLLVNDVPFTKTFYVNKKGEGNGDSYIGGIDLEAVLNLRESGDLHMNVSLLIRKGQTVVTGTMISGGSVKVSDLNFTKAVGKIRTKPMMVRGDFDLDIDFLDKIGGNFQFADPEIKILTMNKGIGVNADLEMDFWVKDGVGDNRFVGSPLVFPVNKDFVLKRGTMVYGGDNLAKFLSLPPKGLVSYEGQIVANGSADGDDVIWKDGELAMDAEINIPLKLRGNLVYQDTLDDISIDADIANKIMSASIGLVAMNGIQMGLTLDTLTLLDQDYQVLARVAATEGKNKLEAAKGKVPSEGMLYFGLTQEQAKLLGRTKHILLDIKATSPIENGQTQLATIYSNATLDLNVVVEAQMKINNFDF